MDSDREQKLKLIISQVFSIIHLGDIKCNYNISGLRVPDDILNTKNKYKKVLAFISFLSNTTLDYTFYYMVIYNLVRTYYLACKN